MQRSRAQMEPRYAIAMEDRDDRLVRRARIGSRGLMLRGIEASVELRQAGPVL